MSGWELLESLEVGGVSQAINADFRDVLEVIEQLNDLQQPEMVRNYIALSLFYADFPAIPPSSYQEAREKMIWFIDGGADAPTGGAVQHKTIDWVQDRQFIISDINKVAGCEIRALSFCHWWTFLSWFGAIGEGQLSMIVGIREKLRTGSKLADWERKFYRENREKVDFQVKYTPEEEALFAEWGA